MGRVEVLLAPGQHPHVGQRDHEGGAVHRVTHRLPLVQDGEVGLVVPAPAHRVLTPPDVEVVFGQLEVLRVSRDPVELRAVEGIPLSAAEGRIVGLEVAVDQVGGADRLLEEVALTGGPVPGRRELELPVGGPGLLPGHVPDAFLHLGPEPGVRMGLEGEHGGFEDAASESRLGPLPLSDLEGDGDLGVDPDLRIPERVPQFDLGMGLRLDGVVPLLRPRNLPHLDVGGRVRPFRDGGSPCGRGIREGTRRRSGHQELPARDVLVHCHPAGQLTGRTRLP